MSQNTRLKVLSLSLVSGIFWLVIEHIGHTLSNLLLWYEWRLANPVSFSIELLGLSLVSGSLVELRWSGFLLLAHHSSE